MRWRRNRRWHADDFFGRFGPRRRRANPLVVAWRWRYELVLTLGLPIGLLALGGATHPVAPVCVLLTAALAYVGWPAAHRFLVDRAWCLLVPHRLRVGMAECGVTSWSGRLPAVLRASRHPSGVRVVLWCPAGVDVHAFHAARSELAAACWAADVLIEHHPLRTNVVVLLVVTRLIS